MRKCAQLFQYTRYHHQAVFLFQTLRHSRTRVAPLTLCTKQTSGGECLRVAAHAASSFPSEKWDKCSGRGTHKSARIRSPKKATGCETKEGKTKEREKTPEKRWTVCHEINLTRQLIFIRLVSTRTQNHPHNARRLHYNIWKQQVLTKPTIKET